MIVFRNYIVLAGTVIIKGAVVIIMMSITVVAGTVSAIALTTERDADSGTIPPGQVKAELKHGF